MHVVGCTIEIYLDTRPCEGQRKAVFEYITMLSLHNGYNVVFVTHLSAVFPPPHLFIAIWPYRCAHYLLWGFQNMQLRTFL